MTDTDAPHKLDEIPGIGLRSAQELIAEIGVTMTAFPSAAHLVSWAKFAPIDRQSAGRAKTASTGKGHPPLAGRGPRRDRRRAGPTDTFLSDRYCHLALRRGKNRAMVAVRNSVLTIIWHVLSEPDTHYHDLGPSYHDARTNQQRRQRELTRQLEHLTGKRVILQPSRTYLPRPDRHGPKARSAGRCRLPTHATISSQSPRGNIDCHTMALTAQSASCGRASSRPLRGDTLDLVLRDC